MLFTKTNTIVYVDLDSISVFVKGHPVKVLDFPKNAVKLGIIADTEQLQSEISKFVIKNMQKGQKCIALLSDKLVFEKKIPLGDALDQKKIEQEFISQIPVKKENISHLGLISSNTLILLGADKSFYNAILDAFSIVEIERVMSATLFEGFYTKAGTDATYIEDVIIVAKKHKEAGFEI